MKLFTEENIINIYVEKAPKLKMLEKNYNKKNDNVDAIQKK